MTGEGSNNAPWFYAVGREQRGPVDEAQIAQLISNGEIGPQSLVWREGMDAWAAAQASLPGALVPQAWVDGLPRARTPQDGIFSSSPAFGSGAAQGAHASSGSGADGAYYHPTDFVEAAKTVLQRYFQFSGRARRSEFWWWVLFTFVASFATALLDMLVFGIDADFGIFNTLFSLAIFIPGLAVGARRLHDVGRSGWWQLLNLVPILGWIVLLIWFIRKGDEADNRFGYA